LPFFPNLFFFSKNAGDLYRGFALFAALVVSLCLIALIIGFLHSSLYGYLQYQMHIRWLKSRIVELKREEMGFLRDLVRIFYDMCM
jgi:hypothetical protein